MSNNDDWGAAERAAQQERMAQQEADYRANREADYQRARRMEAEDEERRAAEQYMSKRSGGRSTGGVPLGCMIAVGTFLILLWGSQFVLMLVSQALGAATMEAAIAAVNTVNGTLIAVLLVGVGLGWFFSLRRSCLRGVLAVIAGTALALGLAGWQLAQTMRTDRTTVVPAAVPAATMPAPTAAAAAPTAAPTTQSPTLETRVVTADVLLLRAEPSTDATVLTRLRKDQTVTLLGEERQVDAIRWVRVRVGEYEGWASAEYLR